MFSRLRQKLARKISPPPTWSRGTHTAYPESFPELDGSWVLRFHSYDPIAWTFRGETHMTRPEFPEPTIRHPNTFPPGQAPADSVAAWDAYYRDCPVAVTLLEEIRGNESNYKAAHAAAAKAMRKNIGNYRRA